MERFEPSPTTAKIRERLDHPVIDSDGHLVEYRPIAMEYIARAGGRDIIKRFAEEQRASFLSREWYGLSDAERMDRWTRRPPFWGEPLRNRGLDLATASFPDLLYARLDQLGIDFAVLFPSIGINPQGFGDEEVRRASCRGLNDYYADHWMAHADRITPVAIIPMFTPQEAIDELDYAVGRGFKVAMLPSYVKRPIKVERPRRGPDGQLRDLAHLDGRGVAATVRRSFLLRMRRRRPGHALGVRRAAQPRSGAAPRDVRSRYRSLGRSAHGERAR